MKLKSLLTITVAAIGFSSMNAFAQAGGTMGGAGTPTTNEGGSATGDTGTGTQSTTGRTTDGAIQPLNKKDQRAMNRNNSNRGLNTNQRQQGTGGTYSPSTPMNNAPTTPNQNPPASSN